MSATMTTIVHDTTEAVCLSSEYNLYLKPIAKMTVSVALPQLKLPGKSISNWEVMERVKAMVAPEQFSALRISKSTMDFIRFEGEVENRTVVKSLLSRLDGKSIKLSGFTDVLKVRAVENKVDFPTRHDWDSFFRDAKDMNETLPGERPDTIHMEGIPCRWFSKKDSPFPDRPSEEVLIAVFETFGKVRNVDIPMLDPYREEMLDKNFNTFSFGGHLNFEAYVQYQEYGGFTKAMDTLRSMKLMLKGEDGKAVACNIKVAFDTNKHLSPEAAGAGERAREREEQERKEQARQKEELTRLHQLEALRRKQEEELRRVEVEKDRALELQRREKELRERLVCNMMKKGSGKSSRSPLTQEEAGPVTSEEASDPRGDDVMLGVLSRVYGVKAGESKEKQGSKSSAHSHVSGKKRAAEERRGGEDRKKERERRKEEVVGSKHGREQAKGREPPHRERSSNSRGRRRRSHSSRRRRSSSRHKKSSSRHRRSVSRHGSRRRSHSSRSTSSSRDRSRSSSGRSYSRGKSHRHRRYSRGSSKASNRSRDRRSHSHNRYKRHSNSRDRTCSRRC
ncbi:A-kinase anchor protein 17A [Dissostichus eleginoides]|uniref:A-kinase anchor protein 17A n=1 Tax=Dissostichus eleginoides TaxID=100907 RepID=A0AAD9CK72_DISEL|nr:A-kinase anchor protein 17A [Dissostichus eleginoides]